MYQERYKFQEPTQEQVREFGLFCLQSAEESLNNTDRLFGTEEKGGQVSELGFARRMMMSYLNSLGIDVYQFGTLDISNEHEDRLGKQFIKVRQLFDTRAEELARHLRDNRIEYFYGHRHVELPRDVLIQGRRTKDVPTASGDHYGCQPYDISQDWSPKVIDKPPVEEQRKPIRAMLGRLLSFMIPRRTMVCA